MEEPFRQQVWQAFGDNLKKARTQRGLTQDQLSEELTLFWPKSSQSSLARMEAGKRMVGIEHVVALTWALKVYPEQLLPYVRDWGEAQVDISALQSQRDKVVRQLRAYQSRLDDLDRQLAAAEGPAQRSWVPLPVNAKR